jgi:toxin secretion/phage lysis holin
MMPRGIDILTNFHFVNETWVLVTPLLLMAVDIVTGTIYAWASKTFQSRRMRTGLSKKVGEISILVIGEVLSFSLGLPRYIMSGISAYIILMELMSVMENADKMGAPIPRSIKKVINNVSDEVNGELTEEEIKEILKRMKEEE